MSNDNYVIEANTKSAWPFLWLSQRLLFFKVGLYGSGSKPNQCITSGWSVCSQSSFSTITALLSLPSKPVGAVVCYSGLFFTTRTRFSAAARSVGFLGLIHWTACCSEGKNAWPSCLGLKQRRRNSTAARPSVRWLEMPVGFLPSPGLVSFTPLGVSSWGSFPENSWTQVLGTEFEFPAGAILASRIPNGIFEMAAPLAKLAVQMPLLVDGIWQLR